MLQGSVILNTFFMASAAPHAAQMGVTQREATTASSNSDKRIQMVCQPKVHESRFTIMLLLTVVQQQIHAENMSAKAATTCPDRNSNVVVQTDRQTETDRQTDREHSPHIVEGRTKQTLCRKLGGAQCQCEHHL